jgi:hypothetical protein
LDKDYENFVERMGSFEDTLDISGDNLEHSDKIVTRNRSALTQNDELSHFGIPGMKWHHHKAVNAVTIGAAARTGEKVAKLGQDVNKVGFNKKSLKEAKSMSDTDLKQLTNRLNLENNYINAKNQQTGRSKVEGILGTAGSALAVASSAAVLYDVIKKARG